MVRRRVSSPAKGPEFAMEGAVGVGLIGCGSISSTYLSLIPQFKGIEVRAVADINTPAAQKRAGEFGASARNVGDLLADDDIDIVLNLTVPEVHFEVSREALRSGKHVYSEKPLALSVADAEQLRVAADKAGRFLGCAPDTFLGGAHQLARTLLDDGRAGTVNSGTCHVMSAGMESWHPNPDFFFRPGGGPIFDLGPYYLAQLLNLLGPIAEVRAMATTAHASRTIGSGRRVGEQVPVSTPTTVHALLQFVGGPIVTLGASWDVQAHRHGAIELYGDKATLFVPDPNFFGGTVELGFKERPVQQFDATEHPFAKPNQNLSGTVPVANYRGVGLAEFANAIADRREPRCSLERTLHAVEVMAAILQSAESGKSVAITSRCTRAAPLQATEARALLKEPVAA